MDRDCEQIVYILYQQAKQYIAIKVKQRQEHQRNGTGWI